MASAARCRPTAHGLRLQDEKVRRPPSGTVDTPEIGDEKLQVLDASDLSAKVLLPARWKPGAYAIRLENGGSRSAPIYLVGDSVRCRLHREGWY